MRTLNEIINLIEEHEMTAYEIAKATTLTEMGISKILNGKTRKPHRSTVHILNKFIDERLKLSKSSKKVVIEDSSIENEGLDDLVDINLKVLEIGIRNNALLNKIIDRLNTIEGLLIKSNDV